VRILFAIPGLHRVNRGAEIAFIAIATELAKSGHQVSLIGSGPPRPGCPYSFLQARCVSRQRFERFPRLPLLRSETGWEELTFVPSLLRHYLPAAYDVTVTCGFPFTNLVLRRPVLSGRRPAHFFVTQNGDWPAWSGDAEFRLFGCDGLICTNPDFYERNRKRYPSALIPNGVDLAKFSPGPAIRDKFGLPRSGRVILMVSALIASKNVDLAIEAVSRIGDATLVVAGDGPLRAELASVAQAKIPGRYRQLTARPSEMPDLYRSADIFLHLSRDESFGNVFVEALAVGTPVVAFDLPRTRWIVGDCGFLADRGDPSGLVDQIEFASRSGSTERARSLARAAEFSWAEVARKYALFFEDVVSARTQAGANAESPV